DATRRRATHRFSPSRGSHGCRQRNVRAFAPRPVPFRSSLRPHSQAPSLPRVSTDFSLWVSCWWTPPPLLPDAAREACFARRHTSIAIDVVEVIVVVDSGANPMAIVAVFVADLMVPIARVADIAEILDAAAVEAEIVATHAIAVVAVASGFVGRGRRGGRAAG